MAETAQGLIGHQIAYIEVATMHQVLLHPKTSQSDHLRTLKQRQQWVGGASGRRTHFRRPNVWA